MEGGWKWKAEKEDMGWERLQGTSLRSTLECEWEKGGV